MIKIEEYTDGYKSEWDSFVTNHSTGSILNSRDFIGYNVNRLINEKSFIFLRGTNIIGLISGIKLENSWVSDSRITYGGIITKPSARHADVMIMYQLLVQELSNNGIKKVVLRLPTYFYGYYYSDHEYILTSIGFAVEQLKLSTLLVGTKWSSSKKDGLRRFKKTTFKIEEITDLGKFFRLLTRELRNKYNTNPVHNLSDLECLKSQFSRDIRFVGVFHEEELLAAIMFINYGRYWHTQYITSSKRGRDNGCVDALFDYAQKELGQFISCGHSNDPKTGEVNANLVFQKEGYGGAMSVNKTMSLIL